MGFALLYQSFSVITALYFRKRLATAYAIGRSGMGLTFALAPFTQLLLDQYAWQGRLITPLMSACLSLNLILWVLFVVYRCNANSRGPHAELGGFWDASETH